MITKSAKDTRYGDILLDDFAKHFDTVNLDERALTWLK